MERGEQIVDSEVADRITTFTGPRSQGLP